MYSMMKFPNLKKLTLVALDMAMKDIAVLKKVMQHIKMVSMMSQSRCNVQHDKVPKPQEVGLGGLGHGHKVYSSVKVGHAAHRKTSMKIQSRCYVQQQEFFNSQEIDLGGFWHGCEVHSSVSSGLDVKLFSLLFLHGEINAPVE